MFDLFKGKGGGLVWIEFLGGGAGGYGSQLLQYLIIYAFHLGIRKCCINYTQ